MIWSNDIFEHNSPDVHSISDFKEYAGKWILKTRSLTRAATLGIVQDVSYLIDDVH